MKAFDLGTGNLNWHPDERRIDRYGTVHLDQDHDDPYCFDPVQFSEAPVGEDGELIAVVLQTRRSSHIGDLFRGLQATTPEVGDEITLGSGTLFVEDTPYGPIHVGLMPDDGRDNDWLDPDALYRCHEQTVRLEFRQKCR
jgi:hypothetical protein